MNPVHQWKDNRSMVIAIPRLYLGENAHILKKIQNNFLQSHCNSWSFGVLVEFLKWYQNNLCSNPVKCVFNKMDLQHAEMIIQNLLEID